ncbi:MAG: acyltransferase [Acidimicrobiia bacterium]|nr:acyltransferase [Acidimicrobiia bacterium]
MSRLRDRAAGARQRVADERRTRLLAAATARDHVPPAPGRFGAYGRNTWLVPPARVTTPEAIFLGDDVTILENSFLSVVAAVPGVTPRLTIGDRTRIGVQSHIACVGEIDIGPDVLIATRVYIGDTYHGYQDPTVPVMDQPMAPPVKVSIGRGAFLGVGCAVLMGVTLGENAYVGAGAVVTADVEARTLVVGNPARPLKRWDPDAGAWLAISSA